MKSKILLKLCNITCYPAVPQNQKNVAIQKTLIAIVPNCDNFPVS